MEDRDSISYRLHLAAVLACCICAAAAARGAGLVGGVRLELLPQRWLDDDNSRISLSGFAGQRVVLTMAYANCHRICPMTIAALERLQSALDAKGQHAQFVVVGYDPDNEDAATWRGYRRSHRLLHPNWHFLTGSADDTARLARQLHFERWKYDEHVMHDSRVLVFDTNGLLAHEFAPGIDDWSDAL